MVTEFWKSLSDVDRRRLKSQSVCRCMIKSASVLHDSEHLIFLTLTSAPNMKCLLMDAWNRLRTEIKRLTVFRLLNDGYITGSEVGIYYLDKELDEKISFDYLAVKTSEGVSGVLHILYYGDYIPRAWLTNTWEHITHTARQVKIKYVDGVNYKSNNLLSEYVVKQYVSRQSKFVSFRYSRNFTFGGFSSHWKMHKRTHNFISVDGRKKMYNDWDKLLRYYLKYGEWGLIRNISVSDMKFYFDKFGSKIVGVDNN